MLIHIDTSAILLPLLLFMGVPLLVIIGLTLTAVFSSDRKRTFRILGTGGNGDAHPCFHRSVVVGMVGVVGGSWIGMVRYAVWDSGGHRSWHLDNLSDDELGRPKAQRRRRAVRGCVTNDFRQVGAV